MGIRGLGSVVWGEMADNAVQMRREAQTMRDTEADRAVADLEQENAQRQIESSMKQANTSVAIGMTAANGVRAGVDAGQNIQALGQKTEIQGNLQNGIETGGDAGMQQLLDTDLGDGQTVADVLGGGDREVAQQKLETILSGNFSSESDLMDAGFSRDQAEALMGLKESGGEITADEAVDFVYAQSPHAREVQRNKEVHGAIKDLISSVQQTLSFEGSRRQANSQGARQALASDRERANAGRQQASRMSFLAVQQLGEAQAGVMNPRGRDYQE